MHFYVNLLCSFHHQKEHKTYFNESPIEQLGEVDSLRDVYDMALIRLAPRADLTQYRELQSFAQFGSDLDADTKARLAQGERIVEVLKQNRSAPVPVEKQVAILYATIHDYLVKVKVPDVSEYEKSLYEYLDNDAPQECIPRPFRG